MVDRLGRDRFLSHKKVRCGKKYSAGAKFTYLIGYTSQMDDSMAGSVYIGIEDLH